MRARGGSKKVTHGKGRAKKKHPAPLDLRIWIGWTAAVLMGVVVLWWAPGLVSGPGPGRGVDLLVDEGETVGTLTDKLVDKGVVGSSWLFSLYLRTHGGTDAIARGAHILTDDASYAEIVRRLRREEGATRMRVTFPEGFHRFDMGKRLQEKNITSLRGFLSATENAELLRDLRIERPTAEGFLFPATYEFPLDADPKEVVIRMKAEFDKRFRAIEERNLGTWEPLKKALGWGIAELVTLASMVEKEAQVDEERALVASVFLNRLLEPDFEPKLLQSDPTAMYGCVAHPEKAPSCASFSGKPSPAINHDPENLYSTYTQKGLPPGPIANPGAKALEAAMVPAKTRYLYFVAKGEGKHTFSEDYAGHQVAVRAAKARAMAPASDK